MKLSFTARIERFNEKGEKTGWTYIEVPEDIASKLKPDNKKSFRVKGKLDDFSISKAALIPMGKGNFILPINETIRKGTGKRFGAMLRVILEVDDSKIEIDAELLQCLEDDNEAKTLFFKMAASHRNYFSKWIASAKTIETKTKRILLTIDAVKNKWTYGELIRAQQARNKA